MSGGKSAVGIFPIVESSKKHLIYSQNYECALASRFSKD